MTKKNARRRASKIERQAMLPGALYKGRARSPKRSAPDGDRKKSSQGIKCGVRMVQIEKYAEENGVTITQAMVHFMDQP